MGKIKVAIGIKDGKLVMEANKEKASGSEVALLISTLEVLLKKEIEDFEKLVIFGGKRV